MQPSAVLLVSAAILALVGLAPPQAESAPAHRGFGVQFYGHHVSFGIGFPGHPVYPRFPYAYYRYRPYPYYYRPGLYIWAYPSMAYVAYGARPSSQGYYPGSGAVRMMVEPREAEVFVDGYYAGIVDDFDGTFQKLYLQPGEHVIELRLEGHRTFTQRILISPGHTQKLHHQMVPLDAGALSPSAGPPAAEPSAVAEAAGRRSNEPGGGAPGESSMTPVERRPGAERGVRPRPDDGEAESRSETPRGWGPAAPIEVSPGEFGVLQLRVQPAEGEIHIDGEPWGLLGGLEEISIHLPAGMHRIELRRAGTPVFEADIQIRQGETTPLNIRLPM